MIICDSKNFSSSLFGKEITIMQNCKRDFCGAILCANPGVAEEGAERVGGEAALHTIRQRNLQRQVRRVSPFHLVLFKFEA